MERRRPRGGRRLAVALPLGRGTNRVRRTAAPEPVATRDSCTYELAQAERDAVAIARYLRDSQRSALPAPAPAAVC
eukprot:COSAG03_NODE_1280_length_4412_cov_1.761651_1_plen_76_part_00